LIRIGDVLPAGWSTVQIGQNMSHCRYNIYIYYTSVFFSFIKT